MALSVNAGYDTLIHHQAGKPRRRHFPPHRSPTRCPIFAYLYTKVHERVLHPLMNIDRPNAPPELTDALNTIDRIVTQRIAEARILT